MQTLIASWKFYGHELTNAYKIVCRYFIVIDDVWRTHDWKVVMSALPENSSCSRIIVTTRITDVGKSCCSNLGEQIHYMEPLDDVDSRRLFLKRIFHNEDRCPVQLEDVSDRILNKCGGLPLAIITLASLLGSKSENKDQWELVLHSIGSTHESGSDLQVLREILQFSYRDLPYHLRTCLLYMSMYPENSEIEREQLTHRWIAEGFIIEKFGQSLKQISDNYFTELINRSLIQPIDIGVDGTPRACRIHDMVLELLTLLAIEENFVTILDINKCNLLPEKIRRLSLHSNYAEGHEVIQVTTSSKAHVRSLCSFGSVKKIPELFGFHALRILDLEGCEWLENHHIRDIGGLFQLKYLRFRLAKISKLPEEIGTLKYLETLDLRQCYHIRELPSTIIQLRKLVRLQVEFYVLFPSKIGDMESLEELSNVYYCNNPVEFVEQLGKLTKLRRLAIGYQQLVENCDDIGKCNDIFVSSVGRLGKHNLQSLSINCEDSMLNSLMGSHLTYLRELNIGSMVSGVSNTLAAHSNLTELSINIAWMQEEDICNLSALPAMLCLRLLLSHTPREELIIGDKGFQHLKHLFIRCDGGGTGIKFAPYAMPQVQQLWFVFKARGVALKDGGVDTGIQHLSSLREVDILVGCDGATKSDVETAEAAMRSAVALLPNRPTLGIKRYWDLMEPYREEGGEVEIATRHIQDGRQGTCIPSPSLLDTI